MDFRRASQALCTLASALALGGASAAPPGTPDIDASIARHLLLDPPVPQGASLGLVMSGQLPGMISIIHTGTGAKSTPASDPAAYADLTFTALTPCRLYDSRPTQGGAGSWVAGSTNTINIGPNLSYAFQGGSATSCGISSLVGPGRIAAVLASVSTVNQAGAGYLAFFSHGAVNPFPYGVTQAYQAGSVQTSFVVIPTDLVGAVLASGYTTAQTNVIIDVVGYFAPPGNINLPASTATTGNILKGAERFIHNFGPANVFVGEVSGNFFMTGGFNTAIGAGTLNSNDSGTSNAASGFNALFSNTTGSGNTASGMNALFSNQTGPSNTAAGSYSLYKTTSGCCNTASGANALYNNTVGGGNTAVGVDALYNTTGSSNIAVGFGAGSNIVGNFNIAIGNAGNAADVGTIRLGTNATHSKTFVAGIRGATTAIADGISVLVDSAGQLGTVSSSRRVKDDIADMETASAGLMALRPVTFHYKSDRSPSGRRLQYGLIAEEVAQVYPGLVVHSADGNVETVMYQFLAPMLLNEYQKQQRQLGEQARLLARQTQRLAELEREARARTAEIDRLTHLVAVIADLKRDLARLGRQLEPQRTSALAPEPDPK